uniref:glycosyltransferase family 4 protein n=1 Tax=uncultured Bacteroides sp. TaxID=162156 RepID=UPI00280B6E40|nr:glycosyltransferase family 4 protein [uncultured Bacteroides sp.]
MSKKILFVDNSTRCFCIFRLPVAKAFIAHGYEVFVMSPEPYEYYVDRITETGAVHIPYRIGPKFSLFGDFKLLVGFLKKYHQLKPNFIVHYTIKPNIYGSIASGINSISSLSVVPGTGSVFKNRGTISQIVWRLYRFAFRFSRKVWVLNEDDRDAFLQKHIIEERKIEILPGEGVDIHFFNYADYKRHTPFVFLYMGRMLREKGLEYLVEAVKRLHEKGVGGFEVQLLGLVDGLSKDVISEEEIRKWEREGLVRYLGSSSDVRLNIEESDCMVLPTFYGEGVPRSLMEACAMGRMVLATDNVGCRDIVQDGYNGVLCKPKDVDDLAFKMEIVLSMSEKEIREMGLNGRERVIAKFDERQIVNRYLEEICL